MAATKFKRSVTLLDATAIGIGTIVGAGIFVVLGVAASIAGPATVFSIIIAGIVAMLTAHSFVLLSERITKEGGAYEFAYELLSPFGGFLTGFIWVVSNVVAVATVSLGFANYLALLLPWMPVVPAAVGICLVVTAINYAGMRKSVPINNALVGIKLATLLFFVGIGVLFFKMANFSAIWGVPFASILSAAAIIFFAYGGFGSITNMSEEVKNPRTTVPEAIMLALSISAAIYLLVSFSAIGIANYKSLPSGDAFLANVIATTHVPYATLVISIGALAATVSVLLTLVMGMSRMLFAMSRNKEAPKLFSNVNAETGVPQNAVLAVGVCSAILAAIGNLALVASISSFAMLAYYVAANSSAIRLRLKGIAAAIAGLGLVSCLVLMTFLSPESISIGLGAIAAGTAYYFLWIRPHAKKGERHHPG